MDKETREAFTRLEATVVSVKTDLMAEIREIKTEHKADHDDLTELKTNHNNLMGWFKDFQCEQKAHGVSHSKSISALTDDTYKKFGEIEKSTKTNSNMIFKIMASVGAVVAVGGVVLSNMGKVGALLK